MNNIKIILIALLAAAIIVMVWFFPLQKTAGVHIVSDFGISQGSAENNSEMESVKVHGTFWNDGDITARNLSATVIFTDAARNDVVRKKVPVEGDLLPDKMNAMEFDSEYVRERTFPKTIVNVTVQFEWMENGRLTTTGTSISGDELIYPDNGNNNTSKLIYGSAAVESIDIMVLESFPVQVNVNAKGYLPDGCTRIDGITQEKMDNSFFINVKTVRPADMFCTQAIVPFQEAISLDVHGLKAGIYTVDVNGVNGTFKIIEIISSSNEDGL